MVKNKYLDIERTLKSIFDNSTSLSVQAKMSLSASILGSHFINWNFCGFYMKKGDELEISSYKSDQIPCSPINMDGVCGKSIISKYTIIVPNVNEFPGHIECDPNSKSEIAIPFSNYVFDIDSKEFDDFDEIDEKYLKKIIDLIIV